MEFFSWSLNRKHEQNNQELFTLQEIPYHLISMEFGVEMDGTQDFFQMFWPVVVSHKIDEKSPLYAMSARDIAEHTFEIILTMEGITPETGNTVQVTSSHQPSCFIRCKQKRPWVVVVCTLYDGHWSILISCRF